MEERLQFSQVAAQGNVFWNTVANAYGDLTWRPDTQGERSCRGMNRQAGQGEGGARANGTNPLPEQGTDRQEKGNTRDPAPMRRGRLPAHTDEELAAIPRLEGAGRAISCKVKSRKAVDLLRQSGEDELPLIPRRKGMLLVATNENTKRMPIPEQLHQLLEAEGEPGALYAPWWTMRTEEGNTYLICEFCKKAVGCGKDQSRERHVDTDCHRKHCGKMCWAACMGIPRMKTIQEQIIENAEGPPDATTTGTKGKDRENQRR